MRKQNGQDIDSGSGANHRKTITHTHPYLFLSRVLSLRLVDFQDPGTFEDCRAVLVEKVSEYGLVGCLPTIGLMLHRLGRIIREVMVYSAFTLVVHNVTVSYDSGVCFNPCKMIICKLLNILGESL